MRSQSCGIAVCTHTPDMMSHGSGVGNLGLNLTHLDPVHPNNLLPYCLHYINMVKKI